MPESDRYNAARQMILEACQNSEAPIAVNYAHKGNARKALQSRLCRVGEICSTIDRVFNDLWSEKILRISETGHLIVDTKLLEQQRQRCRDAHPAGSRRAAVVI